jgi:peptidoglycan/xylan/chitin deacetylase (PgdA/CDA1 family)
MISFPGTGLTTILFHRFFFEGEVPGFAADRLRKQCEWLARRFTPLSLEASLQGLALDQLPPRPLLITIDDAKIEILRVAEIFAEFGLPITIFACVGWCAKETPDEDSLLARLVNDIEWFAGPVQSLDTKWGRLVVGADAVQTARSIDLILEDREQPISEYEAVLSRLSKFAQDQSRQRVSCSWAELAELKAAGTSIGGHSVSHINLAAASPSRLRFEVVETRRALETRFGPCDAFAYPYGMSGYFNNETKRELATAGFRYAFLTHSEYANSATESFELPRISMPDRPMRHLEFCLRTQGAGVLYRRLKQAYRRDAPRT